MYFLHVNYCYGYFGTGLIPSLKHKALNSFLYAIEP